MDGTPGDSIATNDSGTDTGAPAAEQPRALTFAERAAELRAMADRATDFGGLRAKLDIVASFAEAVAAKLDAIEAAQAAQANGGAR